MAPSVNNQQLAGCGRRHSEPHACDSGSLPSRGRCPAFVAPDEYSPLPKRLHTNISTFRLRKTSGPPQTLTPKTRDLRTHGGRFHGTLRTHAHTLTHSLTHTHIHTYTQKIDQVLILRDAPTASPSGRQILPLSSDPSGGGRPTEPVNYWQLKPLRQKRPREYRWPALNGGSRRKTFVPLVFSTGEREGAKSEQATAEGHRPQRNEQREDSEARERERLDRLTDFSISICLSVSLHVSPHKPPFLLYVRTTVIFGCRIFRIRPGVDDRGLFPSLRPGQPALLSRAARARHARRPVRYRQLRGLARLAGERQEITPASRNAVFV